MKEGEEGEAFWRMWGLEKVPEEKWKINDYFDNWFIDPDQVYQISSSRYRVKNDPPEPEEPKPKQKKGLYIFPNATEYLKMMDYDDLNPEALLVLCAE